jgi:hypothetical protein
MKRKMLVLVIIAITVLSLYAKISNTAYASQPPIEPRGQAAAVNNATIDIVINDAGNLSIGGVNLSALGVGALDSQVTNAAKNLGSVHLLSQASGISLDVQGTEIAKIDWTAESRQNAATLASRYGIQLEPGVQTRIEEWISSTTLDVTARFANEPSKPLNLTLSKYLLVEIQPNGQLVIENIPLAAAVDATALQQIQMGGNSATVCWNKGTLTAKVDGQDLPTISLNPDGVSMLANAMNLSPDVAGATPALLGATLGVDVSLPGGSHSAGATCGG